MHGLKQIEGANISHSVTNLNNIEWTEWYYVRGALAPFTVITNLTVVISSGVILKSNVQPRTFYMFMGNLALADLLHGGMTIAELILRTYTQETLFYILQLGLNLSSILASSLGVCVIAVDRYIYLKYSIHYTIWMNQITAKRIIIGIWIYSYMIGFVCEFIFARPVSKNYVDNRFITITPMYMLAVIACSLVIPICITIILYTSILITVYKIRRKEPNESVIKYSKYEERRRYFQTLKLNSFDKSNDTTISTISDNITPHKTNSNQNHVSFTEDISPEQNQNITVKSQYCEIHRDNINTKNSKLVPEQQNITDNNSLSVNDNSQPLDSEHENIKVEEKVDEVKNLPLVKEQDVNHKNSKVSKQNYTNKERHTLDKEQENTNVQNPVLVKERNSTKNLKTLGPTAEQDITNINITEVESDLQTVGLYILPLKQEKLHKLCCSLDTGSTHAKYVDNKFTLFNQSEDGFNSSNKANESDNEIKTSYRTEIYRSKMNSTHRKSINCRSFVMVFLVMFVFTMSWGPYCVSLIIYVLLCHGTKVTESHTCSNLQLSLNTFLLSLGFVNALMNPFLYCWWHKGFRASLRRICCKNNVREKKRNDFISSLRY